MIFNQVFRRKTLVIRLANVGGRMGGWVDGRMGGWAWTISSELNSFYISQRIWMKLSQNDCHQVPWRILSGFENSVKVTVAKNRLNLGNPSECNSSLIFQPILMKLSHNHCYQVPRCISNGIFDWVTVKVTLAKNRFFLHFFIGPLFVDQCLPY